MVEKYQKRGEPPPAPFIQRETLVKTQDETVERRLAGHTEKLERLRVALAEEHRQPLRDDKDRIAQLLEEGISKMPPQQ